MKTFACLFPGQGSQYSGMGRHCHERYASVRRLYQLADEILGFKLAQLCFEGNIEELTRTSNTQPALLITSLAMFTVFMEEHNRFPDFAAGHSLGEFSALTAAGVLTLEDALRLVRRRGLIMEEGTAVRGAMYAVSGMKRAQIEQILAELPGSPGEQRVDISNDNSPEQIVLSGYAEAAAEAAALLEQAGARAVMLNVSAPFHSRIMENAAAKFIEEARQYTYNQPAFPVISNVTAVPYAEGDDVAELLALQMARPVRWRESMQYLHSKGVLGMVEMGPKTVLTGLAVKNNPSVHAFALDREADRQGFSDWLDQSDKPGIANAWVAGFVTCCLTEAVCTRNHNRSEEEYRTLVLVPYHQLMEIVNSYEQGKASGDPADASEALRLLKQILHAKKVPEYEQSISISAVLETSQKEVPI
ncbi:ACP S-malonyltransferase [Paenibacillus odorifer]|uniref:ACP S-malonyltransferase n=1 Tax=Paenibacillus odorifer TaxID=189426 RepID=UPI0020BDAA5C|nr:ACP S-malonyltransferase [Paenibacillus odorifer]